jgi:hypothetical protein
MMLDKISAFDPDFAAPSEWAEMYRSCGLQVVPARFPMLTKDDKRPDLSTWTEFHNDLVQQPIFDRWFPVTAKPNMGVICGKASGNLLVIDLDEYKSTDCIDWWHGLTFGIQQETWQQRTGGGGQQIFYRLPEGISFSNQAMHGVGIDIRCQGGFAMLPPSIHMSGNRYEWIAGCAPWEIECEVAPQKIIDGVTKLILDYFDGNPPAGISAQRTSYAGPTKDAFGFDIDAREEKIFHMVFARLRDLRKRFPTLPDADVLDAEFQDLFAAYLRTTKTRISGVPREEGLEREGRGLTEFRAKWIRTLRKWDKELAKSAAEPDKRQPFMGGQTLPTAPSAPEIDPSAGQAKPLIQTAADFVAGFTPPAYLVDGIIQRGYLYSLTARTGHGKTAVTMFLGQTVGRGENFRGKHVEQGSVLILAGENPDDVRARFLVLAERHGFSPANIPIFFIAGIIDIAAELPRIKEEATKIDKLMLVVVDTAAAYFRGDDGNSNAQMGAYARLLRELTYLPNKPAVIVNCHPVKNASQDNMSPVGGGAFLNEVDGNLTLWSDSEGMTSLHWQGKFRGPEFDPIIFKLETANSEKVVDANGQLMPSVVALPIGDMEHDLEAKAQERDQDILLAIVAGNPPCSIAVLAKKANFVSSTGQPAKSKTHRLCERLRSDKLVELHRGKYRATAKGRDELGWNDMEGGDGRFKMRKFNHE